MRIAVLSPRDPIPIYTGLLERIYQLCRYLGEDHTVRVLFPHEPHRKRAESGRFPDDQPFERVGFRSRAIDALDRGVPAYSFLRGIYNLHPWLYAKVRSQLIEFDPDVLVVEMPFLVPVALAARRGLGVPTLLTEHNVEHKMAERLNVPGSRLLSRFEVAMIERVEGVITVSETDRRILADRVDMRHALVAPNGVDTDRYAPAFEPDREAIERPKELGAPVFVYHGNLGNAQNSEAITILLDRVFPALREAHPESTLLLIGANPPKTNEPGVVCTGLVDDLPRWLAAADAAIVPLESGSGTKLKVLEYFATGLPVVTTSIGAEGLPIEHEEHALIADGTSQLVREAGRVVGDQGLYDRLAYNGRELVEAEFSWERTLRPYDELIEQLGESYRRPPRTDDVRESTNSDGTEADAIDRLGRAQE